MSPEIHFSTGTPSSPKSKKFWLRIVILTIAISIATYILPGVQVDDFFSAVLAAIIISLFNLWLRPLLIALSLPFLIMTMGLFFLVINAAIIGLTAWILPGFHVFGFWYAVFFSLIVSFLTGLMEALDKLLKLKRAIKQPSHETEKQEEVFSDYEDLTDEK